LFKVYPVSCSTYVLIVIGTSQIFVDDDDGHTVVHY